MEFELRAVLGLNDVTYRTYDTLNEAMAVAGVYRESGFKAWVYLVAPGTGRNAVRDSSGYHEMEGL